MKSSLKPGLIKLLLIVVAILPVAVLYTQRSARQANPSPAEHEKQRIQQPESAASAGTKPAASQAGGSSVGNQDLADSR
jgi:hypothetical protein